MSTRLDPTRHAWMQAPETAAVLAALTKDGGAARFVGGCVRNALLGRNVNDIDIATPLLPDAGMVRLNFFYFLLIAASLRVARYIVILHFS